MSSDCIFCKIASKKLPAKLIFEDERFVAFHDVNPAAPTHVLVIPRRHIATLNDIEPEDEALIGGMFSLTRKITLDLNLAEPGYRVVFNCNSDGQQTVFHIHMHILGGRKFTWPPG